MDADAMGLMPGQTEHGKGDRQRYMQLSGMYENWFLDYASYVILERAVPEVLDGLKPVQRRILHAMKEMDDGRYNKVANIIGQTMKYHPHGDASIGDALVQLGQKDILIDCQGNWGNILTGDSAAAPRYIEARLSKFALEVVFNPKITEWRPSYDGRNKEPVCFPMKFPLLLAQGVEGIAVGLASKILPHNFNELIDASIRILKKQDFDIYPDFPTGGSADITNYKEGLRGGKVRVRAKITKADPKTLVVNEIPFSCTTTTLIDSIIAASEKGKVKIRKIDDNTAENVEILIHLPPGVNSDQTIDALYAFTDCEISLSPNSCVIHGARPVFMDVKTMLRISTENSLQLMRKELEIQLHELMENHLFSSLEKIFIEERIYHDIEECETWESVIDAIDKGLDPFKSRFYREIVRDDIIRLTEIKIKRISKYDSFKADEVILSIQDDIADVKNNLDNLVDYAIAFFQRIKQKYGKGRERKTELRSFDQIEATAVAAANVKLYVNREEGFAGWSLKKDEFVIDCSDIDEIIAFKEDGSYLITKIADKVFVGKNVIHIDVFRRNDENTTYNVIYQDEKSKIYYVKRFAVTGIIRDKDYNLCGGDPGAVVYFTANPLGETETLTIHLKPKPRLKKLQFDFDFAEITIKGRNSKGNIISRNPLRKVTVKIEGKAVQKAAKVWFDFETRRLNTEERGQYLGEFLGSDSILAFYENGNFCIYSFHMHIHFEDDLIVLRKYNSTDVFAAVYFHAESKSYYLKRFNAESSANKMNDFIDASEGNRLFKLIEFKDAELTMVFKKEKDKKERPDQLLVLSEFIGVKSFKARGKRLTQFAVKDIAVHKIETFDLEDMSEVPDEAADMQQSHDETVPEGEKLAAVEQFIPSSSESKNTAQKKTKKEDSKNDDDDQKSNEQMTLFDLDL
jgi:topoisomerase IV subunit A